MSTGFQVMVLLQHLMQMQLQWGWCQDQLQTVNAEQALLSTLTFCPNLWAPYFLIALPVYEAYTLVKQLVTLQAVRSRKLQHQSLTGYTLCAAAGETMPACRSSVEPCSTMWHQLWMRRCHGGQPCHWPHLLLALLLPTCCRPGPNSKSKLQWHEGKL